MPYQKPPTLVGQRRDRATLLSTETVDDGMGGQTPSGDPVEIGRIWVRPVPLDERRLEERVMAGQLTAQHSYHFDTRYRTDISAKMQLVWRGKTLEIRTAVDDDGMRRRLVLYCTEVLP